MSTQQEFLRAAMDELAMTRDAFSARRAQGERSINGYANQRLREAEIVNIPFLGALAGGSARRSERRGASPTSEEQRRNAPARAAKNGILAFSASLRVTEAKVE